MTKKRGGSRVPVVLAVALVVAFLGSGVATAQNKEFREVQDRWSVRVGFTSTDTTTDLAAGQVLGAVVRIEEVLDFDENDSTANIGGWYRFRAKKKGKHSIVFNLVDSQRDSSGTISGTVPILDQDFIGDFESSYDTQSLVVAYRYSLIRTPRAEAGIAAGLSVIKYDFAISGEIDDGMGGVTGASEGGDLTAPLPTWGFFIKYGIKPKLVFDVAFDSLDLKIGSIDGRVLNTSARLTWYFTRHFGMGVSVGTQDITVSDSSEGSLFLVDYKQNIGTISFSTVF